jgi:hypothetical protein
MYKYLLRLDMAVLKSDSKIKKFIIRKFLKPIGYWARKRHYLIKYARA